MKNVSRTKRVVRPVFSTPKMSTQFIRGITICTDASMHVEKRVGGYAFHIVCDLFKIQYAGPFNEKLSTSTDAELKAIGNAVAALLQQKELPTCSWVVINTDSKWAINAIKAANPMPVAKKVAELLTALQQRLQCSKIELRYVAAHTGTEDARSFANEWCDEQAKKYMRKLAN